MKTLTSFGETKLNEFETLCRAGGVPITLQRRMILADLAGRCDHPTAEQIYETVTKQYPGISRTTVYRVLETCVKLGVAQKINYSGAATRFDADTRRHHHHVCRSCHQVSDFSSMEMDRIVLPPEIGDGFRVIDYSLTITGFCVRCRTAETQNVVS